MKEIVYKALNEFEEYLLKKFLLCGNYYFGMKNNAFDALKKLYSDIPSELITSKEKNLPSLFHGLELLIKNGSIFNLFVKLRKSDIEKFLDAVYEESLDDSNEE